MRISGGGIDSFLGFKYCYVITLASREFRVLLTILPTSLRCLRIFGLRQGRMVLRPHLSCLPSRFTLVRSLYWVLGLSGVSPGCCCVGSACTVDYNSGSSAGLAQCSRCDGFFPSFAISALVWGLLFFLRNILLLFLGYACGVAFFALSVYSPLLSLLR